MRPTVRGRLPVRRGPAVLCMAALLTLVVACGGGSPAATAAPELRLRLESNDPHVTGITDIHVDLTRGSLQERLRFALRDIGQPTLPVETLLRTTIGAGEVDIEVAARGPGGELLGGGDGVVRLVSGAASRAVVELFSPRSDRPTRARPGVSDGGSLPIVDARDPADAVADLAADATVDRMPLTDVVQPAEVGCTMRTRMFTIGCSCLHGRWSGGGTASSTWGAAARLTRASPHWRRTTMCSASPPPCPCRRPSAR